MTGKTCRPAVLKRAVGRCETAHGMGNGLTPEQSAENRVQAGSVQPEQQLRGYTDGDPAMVSVVSRCDRVSRRYNGRALINW